MSVGGSRQVLLRLYMCKCKDLRDVGVAMVCDDWNSSAVWMDGKMIE
jgi:hypothetical protein